MEVINLKAIVDTIDLIINPEVVQVNNRQAYFKTETHQKFFNIILLDFLSPLDGNLSGQKMSCLEHLINICKNPNFNNQNSICLLKSTSTKFKSWLDKEIKVDFWIPSIGKQCKVKLQRKEFIKICGNISKHNFARLTREGKNLQSIIKEEWTSC